MLAFWSLVSLVIRDIYDNNLKCPVCNNAYLLLFAVVYQEGGYRGSCYIDCNNDFNNDCNIVCNNNCNNDSNNDCNNDYDNECNNNYNNAHLLLSAVEHQDG